MSDRSLVAVYDLSVSPTGFDFATFLTLADIARLRATSNQFRVVFVPAAGTGFWSNETYEHQYRVWRLHHLLIPLVTLFPACDGVMVCRSREEAEGVLATSPGPIFPKHYSVSRPVADAYQWFHLISAAACGMPFPGWRVPPAAAAFVDQWLEPRAQGRKVITITLREARYHEAQNSNLSAWGAFARSLDKASCFPVFVRDTERALELPSEALRDFAHLEIAAFNVALRAALYMKSHLNLMVAGGPMYLALLNPDCRALVFKLLNMHDFRSAPTSIRGLGFEPGAQPEFLSRCQRVVWNDDDLEIIQQSFSEMMQTLKEFPPKPVEERTSNTAQVRMAFAVARRLRTTARGQAARTVYRRLQATLADDIGLAAVKCALSLIDSVESVDTAIQPPAAPTAVAVPELLFDNARAHEAVRAADLPAEALLDIAEWLILRAELDRARSISDLILSLYEDHPEALLMAGEIDMRQGRLDEALPHLGRATRLNPWLASARYLYGLALLSRGIESEAKAEFVGAALADPSHEAARLRLAKLDPDYRLPDGFTYENALSRKPATAVGVVGEVGFPIALPLQRFGFRIIYYFGKFHAVPDAAERINFVPPVIEAEGEARGKLRVLVASTLSELDRILDREL